MASFYELRKALAFGSEHTPLNYVKNTTSSGILVNIIDKIFYTAQFQGKKIACFDVKLLSQCLTPPQIISNETKSDENYKIEIDATHLMSYLSTALQEGFVLHILDNQQDSAEKLALPICFNIARTVPMDNIISFVLDVSGSMSDVFSRYRNELINFISEIEQESKKGTDFQNTTLRIRPFSDTSTVRTFALCEGTQTIIEYLNSLKADGNTLLNGTVANELEDLSQTYQDTNITIVVFTDGGDNRSAADDLPRISSLISQIQSKNHTPKILTFGLGPTYHAQNLIQLSAATCQEHIHLTVIEEFKKGLRSHLAIYCQTMRVIKFVQERLDHNNDELSEKINKRQTDLSFYVKLIEGQISTCSTLNTLVLPGTFTANNVTYTVNTIPAQLTAASTNNNDVPNDVPVYRHKGTFSRFPLLPGYLNNLEQGLKDMPKSVGLACVLDPSTASQKTIFNPNFLKK